ncbi:hypothetical protein HYS54_04980 [Candidatus Micrarchaeota archaeon]|nr:hypothetical protein [Candidatus Micrarchaeota archaeon]
MIAREPTGVPGLDTLIEGGFLKDSITLVSGSPGTGKSIFSQQFVWHGTTKYNQKVMYITLEQRVQDVWNQALRFGWDFEKLQKRGKAKFVFMDITQRKLPKGVTYVDLIRDEAARFKPDRLVIDSLVPLANFPIPIEELVEYGLIGEFDKLLPQQISEELQTRMQVHKLMTLLRDVECTSVVISEIPRNSEWLSRDTVSEFMADSVILMHYLGIGATSNRSMTIEKMRGTKHTEDVLPLEITSKGVSVHKPEEAYKV